MAPERQTEPCACAINAAECAQMFYAAASSRLRRRSDLHAPPLGLLLASSHGQSDSLCGSAFRAVTNDLDVLHEMLLNFDIPVARRPATFRAVDSRRFSFRIGPCRATSRTSSPVNLYDKSTLRMDRRHARNVTQRLGYFTDVTTRLVNAREEALGCNAAQGASTAMLTPQARIVARHQPSRAAAYSPAGNSPRSAMVVV